jgi:hypothetical protein
MKRIYLLFIVLIGVSLSCTKDFEDFNTDKKHPVAVPGGFLFANAQKALSDQEASTNVNLNVLKLFAQYWTETTYLDESNYDIITRPIPANNFRTYYRDILRDLKEAKMLTEAEVVAGDDATIAKANRLFVIDLMEVYVYSILVDVFGNVPYTEALDVDDISPAYDDAFTIYKDLITRATADIAGLNTAYGAFSADDDLYFAGDVAMWKKFGATLKVRLGVTIADADAALAKSTVESAYADAFAMGENCQFVYEEGSNSNPLYQDLIQSGRHDFVPANTTVDMLNNLTDPRMFYYLSSPVKFVYDKDITNTSIDTELTGVGKISLFYNDGDSIVVTDLPFIALAQDTLNIFTYYKGGTYGESNSFSQFSHIADAIQEPTYPMTLLDYTELAFYLAEAAERGFSVGGDAATWYNKGIESSILHWGGTAEEVAAYLGQANVAYATAAGNWKQKIGTQAWLASYVRGLNGWNTWRRLDFPTLNVPPAPDTRDGQVPKRYTYPVNEQTLNASNYSAAAAAIGGDEMDVKVFWDKN